MAYARINKEIMRKKIGDGMMGYYNTLKKEGDIDKELEMNSSCTDISTGEALN